MPTINLGVDYEDVKSLDEWIVVPGGTYSFVVRGIDEKKSKTGRPMLNWRIEVTDPVSQRPVSVFYNTVLPWMDNGELSVKGCGMLVSIAKAVGLPWTGKDLNTEDYIGRAGSVVLKVSKAQKDDGTGKYVDDPDGKVRNEVEKFVY
ncbi:MAG: DUF669 domain-containing protein [Candidatus Paceibacterota bacterium]